MADKDEFTTQGVEGLNALANPAVEVKRKALKVVKAVFDVDPKAQARFNQQYGYPSGKKSSGSRYSYVTNLDLKEGDFAVVETPEGLTVVRVVEVGADLMFGEMPGHKWIIDKVDYEGHQARKDLEKRKQFLLGSLQARAAEIRGRQKLEEVLAEDPASKEMLEELKGLQ